MQLRTLLPAQSEQTGFTLLELMLVITVAAVILGLGIPNLRQFILNNRMTSAANDMMTAVHSARAESVKRHLPVVMCFSASPLSSTPACNGTPTQGWIVFVDDKNPDASEATDDNGARDEDEPVVLRHGPLPDTLSARTQPSDSKGYISFTRAGFARKVAAVGNSVAGVVLCDKRGNIAVYGNENSAARGILISQLGRPRVTRSVDDITDDTNLGGCP